MIKKQKPEAGKAVTIKPQFIISKEQYAEWVTKQNDPVNHPSHYTSGKIEVIDFLEDQKFDFRLANAVKYICRAGKKDKATYKQDLEKAVWYIKRFIEKELI